jgi:hypothetical protein
MPKTLLVLLLAFIATSLLSASSRAAESDRALLSTFCAAANIKGSTCERAKGYPNAPKSGCDVTLTGGRYSGKFLASRNPLLVVDYESGCEAHATNNGGSIVFEQRGRAYAFRGFEPGSQGGDCVASAKDERQQLLVCLTGGTGQGIVESSVALMQFEPDANGHIELSFEMLLMAENTTGAYGTNVVTCRDELKYFDLSKLAAGPRPATVIVDATYADAELIATVCRKDYPKPAEAIDLGPLAPGDAYVPPGREKSGRLVIDLATREVTPQ